MKFNFGSIPSVAGMMLVVWLLLLAGCEAPPAHQLHISGPTMGTGYSVKVISRDMDESVLQYAVEQELDRLNRVFSTYLPDSEVSLLNRDAGRSMLSEDMLLLLELSREIHALSAGAFDITIGPLVNLWGFGPDGLRNGIPAQAEIDALMSEVGFDKVRIDEGQLVRDHPVNMDFSAIAKGFAVDRIAQVAESLGAERYLVEIGGEVKARGLNNRGVAWSIGVEAPEFETRRLQRALPVSDLAVATSGDYRNFFEHEGRVYSHTLDPATGWPVSHNLASVTVLHPSAAWADGLATAFAVLGADKTLEIASTHGLMVYVIIRSARGFEERYSTALQSYLRQHRQNSTAHD